MRRAGTAARQFSALSVTPITAIGRPRRCTGTDAPHIDLIGSAQRARHRSWRKMMRAFTPIGGRLARIGLAFAALVSIASASGPAAADDWNHRHHRHHDNGFFSFQFGSPGYYYAPQGYYYYPQPRYYYPPPAYYAPGPSFNLVIPFGHHRY